MACIIMAITPPMFLQSRLYKFWFFKFWLVFTLNGTQSDHTAFIFSKSISEEQTESLIQFYLPFISIAKFQTITQCFDSKEHYQKNKYFKF